MNYTTNLNMQALCHRMRKNLCGKNSRLHRTLFTQSAIRWWPRYSRNFMATLLKRKRSTRKQRLLLPTKRIGSKNGIRRRRKYWKCRSGGKPLVECLARRLVMSTENFGARSKHFFITRMYSSKSQMTSAIKTFC